MTALPPEDQQTGRIGFWRLAAALATVLLLILIYRTSQPPAAEAEPKETGLKTGGVVQLAQQRPDEPPQTAEIAHTEGMTVLQATLAAEALGDAWAASWRGDGEMALLESLGGIDSQGADGLNWQFEVNGRYADRGAGAYRLEPGDSILWKLAPYE